jgi:DNA repair photolyase
MSKDDVDCIVFWTKNPAAMIPDLEKLYGYNYYFQFTITPYANDMEPGLPAKEEVIETFKRLSNMLGAHRVIWRYDPVLVNAQYGENRHIESFAAMAKALSGFTEKCVISFVDTYPKMLRRMEGSGPYELSLEAKLEMAKAFAKAAGENAICVEACAEEVDFSGCGIGKAKCIDGQLAERIAGRPVAVKKDRSQRKECGCAASMDIGAYNTCLHGCLYCYANSAGRPLVM